MGVSKSLFHDDSMLRTVIREQVVGLSGPRALLMQAAHPVAFAGFFAHTGALDEPYERLSLRAADMPERWDDFQAYMLDMVEGEDLHVSDEARELAVQIVMRPPVPLRFRPALELANQITIGLLPPRLRRQYGFAWDPVRAVAVRGGAEYAKRFVVPFLPERLRVVRSARRAA